MKKKINTDIQNIYNAIWMKYSRCWESYVKKQESEFELGLMENGLKGIVKFNKGKKVKVLDIGIGAERIFG